MASRTLQPSEYEIQREVEALRDIRRRSITPGALAIDPDLPNQSPATSPTARIWPVGSTGVSFKSDGESSTSSYAQSSSNRSSHATPGPRSTSPDATSTAVTDDPFHLFWVPASVHPEIAPAEFRAFLKEHARAVPPDDTDLTRSLSSSSTSSLGRKRSMLRRQYQPRENDGVEEEKVVPLRRNRSYLYTNPVPQLTFNDLQRLEQLAEEASESDDSSKLRTLLRRSLSLNLSPTAIDGMDNVPDMADEADAPIIVPPPGQILRRAARTKIRKPGLPGDGNGHRFGSTRRAARSATLPPAADQRNSSDLSSSDHGDTPNETDVMTQQRRQTFSDDSFINHRPDSFSEEALIFDAYARDEEEEHSSNQSALTMSPLLPSADTSTSLLSLEAPQLPLPEIQPALLDALGSVLHQPQSQRLISPEASDELQLTQVSRTPSPPADAPPHVTNSDTPTNTPYMSLAQQQQPNIQSQVQQSLPYPHYPTQTFHHQRLAPQPPPPRKEKDKKGIFGKWGGDRSSKRANKEKDKESRERPDKEKEKEPGFFGSLFGGSKKKQESDFSPSMTGGSSGRETAQALLGASKSSKNYVPPSSPGLVLGVNPYARYPIHVERAIYRLSHIKLANPRRPLYEQVLISNLMFWYLGVINKAQNPMSIGQPQPNHSGTSLDGTITVQNAEETEGEQGEREQQEREQLKREQLEAMEKERLERERLDKERELEMKRKESGKRGSLTKTPVGGTPSGGRRAEMPIKGPQYEMQHRVMEQEYGNYNMQSNQQQMGRLSGQPNGVPSQHYSRQQSPSPQQYPTSPKLVAPQPSQILEQQFYIQDGQQQQRLPPGAMPPLDQTPLWMLPSNSQQRSPGSQRSRTPPSQNQTSGSPPPIQHQGAPVSQDGFVGVGGGRLPTRSLSANAAPTPQTNGMKVRKGASVHAISPSLQPQPRRPRTSEGRPEVAIGSVGGEEEDTPLATLKQQQRRVV